MELGAFSVSLAVKNIEASKIFYQKMGFKVFAGVQSQNWPIWNSEAQPLKKFTDIRELQRQLKDRGVKMISEADERSTGPASFMVADPDGNTILVDQHV